MGSVGLHLFLSGTLKLLHSRQYFLTREFLKAQMRGTRPGLVVIVLKIQNEVMRERKLKPIYFGSLEANHEL